MTAALRALLGSFLPLTGVTMYAASKTGHLKEQYEGQPTWVQTFVQILCVLLVAAALWVAS